MKQGFIIFSFFMFVSCSTAVSENNANLEGVWTSEDVDFRATQPVLKKHVLTFQRGSYQEAFFENSSPKGQLEGTLLMTRNGDAVEFTTTGNVQTFYQGVLSDNHLMIKYINGKKISPPALYKRN